MLKIQMVDHLLDRHHFLGINIVEDILLLRKADGERQPRQSATTSCVDNDLGLFEGFDAMYEERVPYMLPNCFTWNTAADQIYPFIPPHQPFQVGIQLLPVIFEKSIRGTKCFTWNIPI